MSSWTPILRHCGGLINCPTQFTCFAHFDLCIFRCFITKKHSGAISYDKCPTFCVFKPYPQFLVLSFCLTSMPIIAKIHHDAGNFQFVFFLSWFWGLQGISSAIFLLRKPSCVRWSCTRRCVFRIGCVQTICKKCKKCAKMQTPWKTICPWTKQHEDWDLPQQITTRFS